MSDTSIQWTDKTWNPVTGCDKVSPGCKNCYAERVFPRSLANQKLENQRVEVPGGQTGKAGVTIPLYRGRNFTDVMCHEDRLEQPLHWKKGSKIFVNSMSDLFHDDVPDEFIMRVFGVIQKTERHIYQILTKRIDRAYRLLNQVTWQGWPLKNVWLGVSVENQEYLDKRVPLLLQAPAAIRFVSYEPALGPIDFDSTHESDPCESNFLSGIAGERVYDGQKCALDWVIVGGESGPGARPFNIEWARSVVRQCKDAGVACFVKQLGKNPYEAPEGITPSTSGPDSIKCKLFELDVDKGHGGDMIEWPADIRVREFPNGAA